MILYLLLPVKEFNDWYYLLEAKKQKIQEATESSNRLLLFNADNKLSILGKVSSIYFTQAESCWNKHVF